MDIETRIANLHQAVDAAIEKAKRVGRPRIPGDGDGDGIPHEGRRGGGGAKPAGRKASLIDVLNNPAGREMVEAIEDTIGSLDGKKGDRILGNVLRAQIKELKDRFGFEYQAQDALRDN
jgi:hypothetical protein